ncbi:MAG: hypothetical protein ING66_04270 [Rhodocyclaceae bacterium]|nr:hypothetical protein [Rhodocyclaceae bacterium]MCA3060671.1 hypothetical protein [Rhodocyclaceae bacterium]MCA3082112.1 hypothetical protein [Rhodocyclaceae bacterium]
MKNKLILAPSAAVNLLKRVLLLITTATSAVVLTGCGPEVWKWQEEARLDDGKILLVDREVIFGGARLPWEKDRLQSEYILRFASPTDPKSKYEYRSIGGLAPAAIAFVGGVPLVVGATLRGDAIMYYDCPDPPLVVHRHDNGKWRRTELKALPPTLMEMNLALFSNPAMQNAEAGGRGTAQQVDAWNKTLGRIGFGKHADQQKNKLVRLPEGQEQSDCKSIGESKMPEEWKIQFKARFVPKITE